VTGPINLPFRQAYGSNFYRKEERGLDGRLFGEFKPQSPTLVVNLPIWRLLTMSRLPANCCLRMASFPVVVLR